MAEVVYNESKSVNEEIYVSDFKINIKNQYIGIAEKIDNISMDRLSFFSIPALISLIIDFSFFKFS